MKSTIVAGNWKLNKTPQEARRFIKELWHKLVGMDTRAIVVVFPPFVALETAVDAARSSSVHIGAQDVFWEADGAFTGEVSAEMLEAIDVEYALIGHSERRALFGETDANVNRKLRHVLGRRLTPIVCVGETLEQREAGETDSVVSGQIRAALDGVAPDHVPRVVAAYEPVWAIGTGKTATPEMANEVHALIRRTIGDMFGGGSADGVPVIYGGSVKPENAAELMAERDIDGVLVGGASLDAAGFAQIVSAAP